MSFADKVDWNASLALPKGEVVFKAGVCTDCTTTEGIVFSGVDAFMLECIDLVERICYNCANRRRASLA